MQSIVVEIVDTLVSTIMRLDVIVIESKLGMEEEEVVSLMELVTSL